MFQKLCKLCKMDRYWHNGVWLCAFCDGQPHV
jgi:hypothetical protein